MRDRQLPSMGYLRAFEATARHLSFTRASLELHLTRTAISHSIRSLEELVGARLFEREGPNVVLTVAGQEYLENVRPAMLSISSATTRLIDSQNDDSLAITTHIHFGLNYLLPSLGEFQKAFPHIALRVATIASFDHVHENDYDVAVRYGVGRWHGMVSRSLGMDDAFPVCSPALLASGPPLRQPVDLESYPIIRTTSESLGNDWPPWLEAAGATTLNLPDTIVCDHLFTATRAAVSGIGITMGRSSMVRNDIASGALVAPFETRIEVQAGYHVVSSQAKSERPAVQLFTNWLLAHLGVA